MSYVGVFGLLGVLVGVLVSWFAFEELKSGRKFFRLLRRGCLAAFSAFFLFHYFGIVWMVIGLLILILLIKWLSDKRMGIITTIIFAVACLFPLSESMTGFFFLTGLFEGGFWSAQVRLRQILKKPTRIARTFVHDQWWYLLPVITGLLTVLW